MAEYIISINHINKKYKGDKHQSKEKWEGYEIVTNKDTITVLLDMNSQCQEEYHYLMMREKDSELTNDFVKELSENLFVDRKTGDIINLSRSIKDITLDCETDRMSIHHCQGDESWVILKKEYIKDKDVPWDKLISFNSNDEDEQMCIDISNYEYGRDRIYMDKIDFDVTTKMSKLTFKNGKIFYCPTEFINDKNISWHFENLSMKDIKTTEEFERSYKSHELDMINDICTQCGFITSASIKITTNKGILYLTGWEFSNGYYSHDVKLSCSDFDYQVSI